MSSRSDLQAQLSEKNANHPADLLLTLVHRKQILHRFAAVFYALPGILAIEVMLEYRSMRRNPQRFRT